jgi:hypothetical protein
LIEYVIALFEPHDRTHLHIVTARIANDNGGER